MQVWEEMKDTSELDSSNTVSEKEDKLTSEDLLQDLDKAAAAISSPVASRVTRACSVLSIAQIETGRTIKGASGGLPDMEKGTTKVIWEWERVDMVIGRDNMDCKPEHLLGWPEEGFTLEIMGPLGFYTRKDLEELNRRN
jgi:hypothetical protein